MDLTVIIPTFNEEGNVPSLVRRLTAALTGRDAEILFVDDSSDGTADAVRRMATETALPVRVIHREAPEGGLGGAVVLGMREARSDVVVVMDGDLQHPPETVPMLHDRWKAGGVDTVIASRYTGGGSASGLANRMRTVVSRASTGLTKAMFPVRLAGCTDPMTGFFLVDRRKVDLDELRPRGFKILLEILARNDLRRSEVGFEFTSREDGLSKASWRQGIRFLVQLAVLRFGKMGVFAIIGGLGALANIAIMWVLTSLGVDYVIAAIVGAEATIVGNFLLQERFVFDDMRERASGVWTRFAKSFAFNNVEAAIRIPILALMVETWHISSVVALAITLAVAFVARYVFHALVVYAPRKSRGGGTHPPHA